MAKAQPTANRSDLIREAIEVLGGIQANPKPKAIQAAVKEASGVDVTTGLIGSVKSKLDQGGSSVAKKPGRPAAPTPLFPSDGNGGTLKTDIATLRDMLGRQGREGIDSLLDLLQGK